MEFTPDDILNVLRDEGYECKWILTVEPLTIDNYKKKREPGILLKILLNNTTSLVILDVLPYIEEVVDRFEGEGYYFDYIQAGMSTSRLELDMSISNKSKKYTNLEDIENVENAKLSNTLLIQFQKGTKPSPTKFQKIKSFLGFNESINESNSSLKFIKQPVKKGAKTEVYNVVKDGVTIGQIKWSSRMRGYGFLPTKDAETKVKNFTADLMKKWRAKRKKEK